jgi:hypothetical protein
MCDIEGEAVGAHSIDHSVDKSKQVFSPAALSQEALIDPFDAGAVERRCASIGGRHRGSWS